MIDPLDDSPSDEDDIPTARTCPECKGEGKTRAETESTYMQLICGWCKGTGRVPVSGEHPAVKGNLGP